MQVECSYPHVRKVYIAMGSGGVECACAVIVVSFMRTFHSPGTRVSRTLGRRKFRAAGSRVPVPRQFGSLALVSYEKGFKPCQMPVRKVR